ESDLQTRRGPRVRSISDWYWFSLNTPKALANFSPGLFQPWVNNHKPQNYAESVGELLLSNASAEASRTRRTAGDGPESDLQTRRGPRMRSISDWYWFSLNTPKALANFSPGLFQPWVNNHKR